MKYRLPGYIIFFAACVVFSLYLQFPDQLLAGYIEKKISKTLPGISMHIDALAPSLPFGVRAESIQLTLQDGLVFQVYRPVCTFDMRTLLNADRRFNYSAAVLNGRVSGTANFENTRLDPVFAESRFEDIQLESLNLGTILPRCSISGLLNGQMDLILDQGGLAAKQGDITIKDLLLDFSPALYGIEQFTFSLSELRFNMPEDGVIGIETLKMTGRQMDIIVSGNIALNRNSKQSRLDLKTRMELYPLFFMNAGDAAPIDVTGNTSDSVVFHLLIAGTLQNPQVTIDKDGT
jgi:type II secretion system protein N